MLFLVNMLEEQNNRSLLDIYKICEVKKMYCLTYLKMLLSYFLKQSTCTEGWVLFTDLVKQTIISEEYGEESHTAAVEGISAPLCSYDLIFFLLSLVYTVASLKTRCICFPK